MIYFVTMHHNTNRFVNLQAEHIKRYTPNLNYKVYCGMSGVENDVIPYGSAMGNRAHLSGLNIVGLKRRGFSRQIIHNLRKAYRLLFAEEGTMSERIDDVVESFGDVEPVMDIINFIRSGADTARAICRPKLERAA